MNIPRTDALKPRPRLGTPSRSQQQTKLVEQTTDAHKLQTVPISTTLPTNGQGLMYDSALGQYKPASLAAVALASTEEAPIGVFSAQMLQYGPSTAQFGPPTDSLGSGDFIVGPSGIQRMEVLSIPRVGSSVSYSNLPSLASGMTATQTTVSLSGAPSAVPTAWPQNGHNILVDQEAMFVLSGGGTATLTVNRGQLQSVNPPGMGVTHNAAAQPRFVNVESVVHINKGLRAMGGVAMTDLALHGDSPNELVVRRTFTQPIATYAGNAGGRMILQVGDHAHATSTDYRVEIDGAGGVTNGTFKWSDDGGGTWIATGVPISQNITHLQSGVYIAWEYGSYFVGDRWDFTAVGNDVQEELMRVDTIIGRVNLGRTAFSLPQTLTSDLNLVHVISGLAVDANNRTLHMFYATPTINNAAHTGTILRGFASGVGDGGGGTFSQITHYYAEFFGFPFGTATVDDYRGVHIAPGPSWLASAGSLRVTAVDIGNIGLFQYETVTGIKIAAQTAGSVATYNIWQAGTTGVNRLAAPTLIGADASPAAGMALELRDDLLMAGNIIYGNTSSAGNLLLDSTSHATKGQIRLQSILRLAASPNNIIQNSAGTTAITLATAAPIITLTGATVRFGTANASLQNSAGTQLIQMRASGVRLSPNVGINVDPVSGIRLALVEDAVLGAGQTTLTGFFYGSTQSANKPDAGVPAYVGFYFQGNHEISDFGTSYNLGTFAPIFFDYSLSDWVGGGTVTEDAPIVWNRSVASTATVTDEWAADIQNWPGGFRQRQTDIFNRFGGAMTVGADQNPAVSALIDMVSTTKAPILPRMTTAQRDAMTLVNGMVIYNTTVALFQCYEAGAWRTV